MEGKCPSLSSLSEPVESDPPGFMHLVRELKVIGFRMQRSASDLGKDIVAQQSNCNVQRDMIF